MTTLFILIIGYFAFLAMLSLIARPYRLRLKSAGERLLADSLLTDDDAKMVRGMLSTAYSIRTTPVLVLVFLTGVLRHSEQLDFEADSFEREYPSFVKHHKTWHEMLEMHMVSAFAVNPIFGVFAYLSKWMFRAKVRAHFTKTDQGVKTLDFYEIKVVAA
jgi:hypothetical protein